MVAISPFITESTSVDFFHDMIVCCLSAKGKYKGDRFIERVSNLIFEASKKRNDEIHYLYNPYKNISINQCIGDGKIPVSDWLNLSDWFKWK